MGDIKLVPKYAPGPVGACTEALGRSVNWKSCVIVALCDDGTTDFIVTPTDSFYQTIGILAQVQHDMLKDKSEEHVYRDNG